jgi:hypothetical protein
MSCATRRATGRIDARSKSRPHFSAVPAPGPGRWYGPPQRRKLWPLAASPGRNGRRPGAPSTACQPQRRPCCRHQVRTRWIPAAYFSCGRIGGCAATPP